MMFSIGQPIEYFYALAISGGLLLFNFLLVRFSRYYSMSEELKRKIVHLTFGCVSLSFPWIFSSTTPVAALMLAIFMATTAIKRLPWLHRNFGCCLYSVNRSSKGEMYFFASVVLLFFLAEGSKIMYFLPILILTVADSIAALVGVKYGIKSFETPDGKKSLEGIIAFFVVAFNLVLLTFLLFPEPLLLSHSALVLIALILATITTLLESCSWNGLDNLLIPIGAFVTIQALYTLSPGAIMLKLAAIIIATFIVCVRNNLRITIQGRIATTLGCSLILLTGGVLWLIPNLIFRFAVPYMVKVSNNKIFCVRAVACIVTPPLFWIFIEHHYGFSLSYLALYTGIIANLTMVALARLKEKSLKITSANTLKYLVIASTLTLPWYFVFKTTQAENTYLLLVTAAVLLAAYIFARMFSKLFSFGPNSKERWLAQTLFSLASSILSVTLINVASI